jgi:DNA polymerase elongation subunit (family B)
MDISQEEIKDFLEGRDPQKYIVSIESSYDNNFVNLIINDPENGKRIEKHKFRPFLWMKTPDMTKFFKGDRRLIKLKMREHMISINQLRIEDNNGETHPRLESGFKFLVETRGSYRNIINFFKESGFDMQKEENRRHFLTIGPTEQFLIQTGKRLFKGFDDYADLVRFSFDIETTSLTPETGRILQIGMKDNRGFEHVLDIESDNEEREAIETFFNIIDELKPDIICGYNSENFDWTYILGRCELLNLDYKKITKTLKRGMPLYRKQATLKMGAEMEYYQQTVMWGYNILDVWHAVRRAKAINSNIKETGLKYITKYSKIAKPNRVYVGHDKIAKIWDDDRPYLFNESNGKYIVSPENKDGYEDWEEVDGKFIIKKYLIDDLWETEQVDYKYNQATFLLSKLVPSTLQRTSTMGTAALWKILMCAWSYENGLAIPDYQSKEKFPGGLSRLLRIGFVPNVVKLDYGSLYPSIQLTHGVFPEVDITGALKGMLTYLFATRDLYKNLMKKAQKEGDDVGADMYDKKQLPIKILNNSNFGSVSAPDVYPWGDTDVGAMITCTGRQYLRLMIRFFMEKGFEPIVGDSVTYDTPVYIKYGDDMLDILPISDLFDITGTIEGDQLRDYSDKPYKILTRSGWKDIKYVYRHSTDKQIHRITTKDRLINVTEDHSLFQNGKEIKPSELKRFDKLDTYEIPTNNIDTIITPAKAYLYGFFLGDGSATCSSRKQKYVSRKTGLTNINKGKRSDWKISNSRIEFLEKLQSILKNEFSINGLIKNHIKSSRVYNLVVYNKEFTQFFCENFYTGYREKKIPNIILNSTIEVKKAFIEGVCASDGYGDTIETCSDIGMKSQVAMCGIGSLLKELGVEYKIKTRSDKQNFISFSMKNNNRGNSSFTNKTKKKSDEVWKNEIILNKDIEKYVYDVSTEDGTFICGINGIIAHNTDGFNFKIPENANHLTYIGLGNHQSVVKDKKYVGIEAALAEFNEKYMRGFMKLGIDEVIESTINLSRKNYADLIDGEVKLVGNTIKSAKMPKYIEDFLDKAIRMLLEGNGTEFIELYYENVEMIYNQEIPLLKIASKGKVKQTLESYKENTKRKNKAGNPMPRQAHMELLLKENINVNLGDTIYYINTGTKKSHADVKAKKNKDGSTDIEFNSSLILTNQIENNPELKGEYNISKYLTAFNTRIEPLLVCFNIEIRDQILIDNPSKRQYFTEKQLELCSGFPTEPADQDTLDDVFVMEQKEIDFWNKVNVDPEYMYVTEEVEPINELTKENVNDAEYF